MSPKDQAFYETIKYIQEHPEEFVLLDTETTGLGAKDQIVELGILSVEGTVLIDTLVKPTCTITPAAAAVSGISDLMLVDAPSWKTVWDQAQTHLKNKRILAYNAPFDMRMIRQSCMIHGLKVPKLRPMCLMELVTEWLGFRPKLEYFAQGVQSHRAVDDCRVMLDNIIRKNIEKLKNDG